MHRSVVMVVGAIVTALALVSAAGAHAAVTFTHFGTPTSDSGPFGITLGSDGNIWFGENTALNIGQFTPSAPPVFNFEYPDPTPHSFGPEQIVPGGDGALWFTDLSVTVGQDGPQYINRVTTNGGFTLHAIPSDIGVKEIAWGADGNVWFTDPFNRIGRMTPSGTIKEFPLPPPTNGNPRAPEGIAEGPDGNIWFTEANGNVVGRITPAGVITQFAIPWKANSEGDITAGPDGNLWFTEGNAIGRVSPSGVFAGPYPLPGTEFRTPGSITPVPCSPALAFTDVGAIGKITVGGAITEYPTDDMPSWITAGPSETMWFTEPNTSQIVRITGLALPILCVPVQPRIFVTPTAKDSLGGTVGWMMQWPGTHGVADTSGLRLFSTPRGIPMGRTFSYRFTAAGSYAYDDPFHPATTARVTVPVKVAAVVGAVDTAQVTWAVAAPAAGSVFDVQIEVPGSPAFRDWQTGTSAQSAVFGPADPMFAGPGTYRFRARLRNAATGAASGYSPVNAFTLP
jgi:streptogramin lyase